nr:hypothetical protein [Tanacetum cinerariifolium]
MFDVDDLGVEEVSVAEQDVEDIQAKIDADHQLAERLQAPEQSKLSDCSGAEKAILFQQLLEKRKKHLAFKRVNTFEDIKTELVKEKEQRIQKEGKKSYNQIVRADEKSQMYMFFSQMLKSFNKEDLEDLYMLVKARYGSTRPVENMDYLLWSDIKLMFEPHVEDKIYMLVEKKHPLTPPTLSMMLEKKLQIDYESEMAYHLCKLIKKQLKK